MGRRTTRKGRRICRVRPRVRKGNLMAERTLRQIAPVALSQVRLTDGFWAERTRINREVTLPIEYEHCKKTGRIDAWRLQWKKGAPNPPHKFWDSDVAKWIEAAAYSLTTHPDENLEALADGVIELISKAQQPDGYLNVHFTVVEPEKRWSNLRQDHELYCAGHLMEAAVAYYRATGKRKLLEVLCRYADLIDKTFGPRAGQKRGYPGHEEIELALVKLHRATGEERYLRLSKFFIDQRGTQPHYFDLEAARQTQHATPPHWRPGAHDYNQAHMPVREQKTAEGHAVRACYLYAAMADVAIETGDRELLMACRRIWRNIVERRMYIHGGVGSSRFGERFTLDYDLPNEDAYAETCAAIALVFFAHRMLQADPDAQYADVIEQALYNGIISGVSYDGTKFFYDNLLAVHPDYYKFSGQKAPWRQEWFGCACCPPNLARLLASLGGYVYSEGKNVVWVHLYASSRAELVVGQHRVVLEQKTGYPWKEKIRIRVRPDSPLPFTLAVRIPGWCRKASVTINSKPLALGNVTKKGYAHIKRKWQKGDTVELTLPMPVERIEAHPKVRHDAGRVALQRGPVLYCLEEVDNGKNLNAIVLPRDAAVRARVDRALFGGVPVLAANALRRDARNWGRDLYRPFGSTKMCKTAIKAIPYFLWANRGLGEMLVWIPTG